MSDIFGSHEYGAYDHQKEMRLVVSLGKGIYYIIIIFIRFFLAHFVFNSLSFFT